MSSVSQGPGWWMASDHKWYPPESHPDYLPPPYPSAPGDDTAGLPSYPESEFSAFSSAAARQLRITG